MNSEQFVHRHNGSNAQDAQAMLHAVGAPSLDALIEQTVPAAIRLAQPLDLPPGMSEHEYLAHLRGLAARNQLFKSYIGLGYHGTVLPAVIQRNVLENPGWYTAYTPYQAEIAQGRLEALLVFQTMVMSLTGMEIANASLLDEATAAAEAMVMLHGLRSREDVAAGRNAFFVSHDCFPQTIEVLKTRARPLGIELVIGDFRNVTLHPRMYGALLQYPAANGAVHDYTAFVTQAKAQGMTVAVAADLLSLVLLPPPGEWGADVVLGSTQRFGVPLGYGGPHAAYFATRDAYKRSMPGRIIGVSVDADGNPALRMALQTREQHIRREKATSNICTAQALLAMLAAFYAVYHGPQGLRAIAERVHRSARALAQAVQRLGYTLASEHFFDTLKLAAADHVRIRQRAEAARINFRYSERGIGIALDETTTVADLNAILAVLAEAAGQPAPQLTAADLARQPLALPLRQSPILDHPVFGRYHTETEMMRYLKRLENRDLSLTHSMISLGSCTMKLNAAAEMLPLTWPEFADLHPFAPKEQAQGYQEMMAGLEDALCHITGFAAVSFQPNSGASGEYAGLLVIRAWHQSRGEGHRDVVLIPSSAHGTNPASAAMAGLSIVVVKCDAHGNIDLDDLRTKAEEHRERLACLMVTYPSTHGVYEEAIRDITALIHAHGGQVYMDGANMNAQVGLTNPATIGADVCHLNLHKTFAIPHGGGGPGVGPIAVAAHLAPFLPRHPLVQTGGAQGIHAVSAAPFGSALILLIAYGYIKLMGGQGLTEATKLAILNANYLKERLAPHYATLYSGAQGRCAHELILDCRAWKKAGVEVTDIAKRLMDFGFHAPTTSFPVVDTLMVEPTESESKAELDRFVEAMIAIRAEIEAVVSGNTAPQDSPLKHAPHTAQRVCADDWARPYPRSQAAYPLPWLRERKFWPAVARVDNVHGDKHLICACPPDA